jgi:broad specificity phosphatase PhoE
LVRHGQSQRNIAKKRNRFFLDDEARRPLRGIPGHVVGFTDLGWHQARETGVGLRDRFGAFDQIYHSWYQRAVETTTAMLDAYGRQDHERMRVCNWRL